MSILIRSQPHAHLHFMPGRSCNLTLLPRKNELCRASCFQCDKRGIDLAYRRLFCTESAADPGLFHTDFTFGDSQRPGKDPANVKYDLGRGDHMQSSVSIQLGIGTEGLHHRLIKGTHMVRMFQHLIAVCKHRIHVPVTTDFTGNQVPPCISAHRNLCKPVLFRMH